MTLESRRAKKEKQNQCHFNDEKGSPYLSCLSCTGIYFSFFHMCFGLFSAFMCVPTSGLDNFCVSTAKNVKQVFLQRKNGIFSPWNKIYPPPKVLQASKLQFGEGVHASPNKLSQICCEIPLNIVSRQGYYSIVSRQYWSAFKWVPDGHTMRNFENVYTDDKIFFSM